MMTRRERAQAALERKIPDSVPTFELEFQLEEEMFGRKFITPDLQREELLKLSQLELEKKLYASAEYFHKVYSALEYSIIPAYGPGKYSLLENGDLNPIYKTWLNYLKEMRPDAMLAVHGDGTFAIPDGDGLYAFSYCIVDDPDGLKEEAERKMLAVIERNKIMAENGVEVMLLCSDYCFNSGPFLSPAMFEEFIQPYLYQIVKEAKANGQYVIKHTDGNIMPILDMLVACEPHALHSIDPMAGVDIREVKRLVGDKVCLCGNVHCAALQTGTDEEVIVSAEYCLTHGKPGGGYIYCTSNIPFRGMAPERYQLVLDVWKRMREY